MNQIIILILLVVSINSLNAKELKTKIEYVGTPYNKQYKKGEDIYSRNVWDMQVYDGKLFIGAGNSANEGPSINSGPVKLMVYNPQTKKFTIEGIIDDDQVDIFKVLNNNLLIPGHDAKGSWRWGNFYNRSSNGEWKKYRNIPNALHVYDLEMKDRKLFAGIGLNEGAAVGITSNLGKSWEIIKLGKSRVYSFLSLGNELFALKKFKRTSRPYFSVAQYINGVFMPRYDISIYDMFPNTKFKIKYSRATRIISFDKKAMYIGAYKYNSHQTKPFGVYVARLIGSKLIVNKVQLEDDYIPRDIIKRNDTIYLLVSKENRYDTSMKVLKLNTHDLRKKELVLTFDYPTFARSFELIEDTFYFGMGSDVDEGDDWNILDIKRETGDILKYKVGKK